MVHFEEKHKFEGSFPVEFMVKTCFEEGKKPHFEKVFFRKVFLSQMVLVLYLELVPLFDLRIELIF